MPVHGILEPGLVIIEQNNPKVKVNNFIVMNYLLK